MGCSWNVHLVGGIPTPLKNMSSSVGMMTFPTEWEKKCSKPPTSSLCVCLYFYVFVYAFMKLSIATLNKKNRFGKILLQLARYLLPVLVGGIVGTIQGCNINPTA